MSTARQDGAGSEDHGHRRAENRPLTDSLVGDEVVWGLVDAAPDGIVMVDREGRVVLVNHQTELLFGYDRGELLGRPVEDLIPDRYRRMHRAHRTRYAAEPQTRPMGAGIELVARRSDGTEFRVEISLSPLRVGTDLFVVAAVRDITERVAAEAFARRVQELLDATRDGIYISDADTLRFTYVNQGAVDQVGYSRDELARMSILHIAPEFDEASWRSLLDSLGSTAPVSSMFTTRLIARDGAEIPAEVLLQTGAAAGDQEHAFVCIVRDVRDRVEAEERLWRADQELRLLEDRERIARDLHDTVIQRLFAAGMSLQATMAMPVQGTETATRIAGVVEELDETIRELRNAIYGLQARTGSPLRLGDDIRAIVEEQRDALGSEPALHLDADLDTVPMAVGEHLLATLREALSNVARHAQATRVDVTVTCGDDVVLHVADDGVGPPASLPERGHGLRNMAERAGSLGGTCVVRPGETGGTVLEWRVPVAAAEAAR